MISQFGASVNGESSQFGAFAGSVSSRIGGYRCDNVTRQAFDAARGSGHFLDLLFGGFPGADAPSIGTEKTVFRR